MSTLAKVPVSHGGPDTLGPAGVAEIMDTGEVKPPGVTAHELGRWCLSWALSGVEPAGEAERAAAAKYEALVRWAQGVAKHKIETLP